MILRSAGFVTSSLIFSQNAINFAYILYLRGRSEKIDADILERLVRKWYAMSLLSGRYSGSPESQFDFDIRQVASQGLAAYVDIVLVNELPDSFWNGILPQFFATSSVKSPYFLCYQAAQVKLGDRGFLSRDITASDLLLNRADVHHIYPRQHLKSLNHTSTSYNQIANYVIAQSEINIAIGAKAPVVYFAELRAQVSGGVKKYGGIVALDDLLINLRMNCIPESMLDGEVKGYEAFLEDRRKLMASKIKTWFKSLG